MKYTELTGKLIKYAMTVHNTLSNGYKEEIYQRAFEIELKFNNLSFKREYIMPIFYKDIRIGDRRVDFFVDDTISVEFKAISKLEPVHFNQALNYLGLELCEFQNPKNPV